jgi:hypothetical protein
MDSTLRYGSLSRCLNYIALRGWGQMEYMNMMADYDLLLLFLSVSAASWLACNAACILYASGPLEPQSKKC